MKKKVEIEIDKNVKEIKKHHKKIKRKVKKKAKEVEKDVKKVKRRLIKTFIGLIPLLFILGFIAFTILIVPEIESVYGDPSILGAHRGNSVDYIENTIPAFKSALIDEKYKFIEFDVQYTKDKKMVVFHDSSLERLQDKENKIKDLTYEELMNISDYYIPTYSEVMNLISEQKPVNIEIKSQGNLTDDIIMVEFIISDLKDREILDTSLISAISIDILSYIEEKYPEVKTGKIYWITSSTFLKLDAFTSGLYEELEDSGVDYLMLHGSNLRNHQSLGDLLPEGKTLVFWYFTDEMHVVNSEDYFGGNLYAIRLRLKDLFSKKEKCIWWC